MNSTAHTPCVMTDTDSFYVRICGCGVVHLCFGPTTLNLSPESVVAVTETLKEISAALRAEGHLSPLSSKTIQMTAH